MSAIVVMCHELDAMVVAEGIETLPELEAVRATGARFGQGYLLARPAFPLPVVDWPAELEGFDEDRKTRTRTAKDKKRERLTRVRR